MELRHLRYFIAVAEELSFSRAAQRLHVSQPPLSRQIQDLENELGSKLLERDRQGVSLTKVGRRILAKARGLVLSADDLKKQISLMRAESKEELQIGYSPAPTAGLIASVLGGYHRMAPGAAVTLHDLTPQEILVGLRTKRINMGLTLRPSTSEMRGLKFKSLRRYAVGIICSPASPWAARASIRPADLPVTRLIGYRSTDYPEYHQWVAKVLARRKSTFKFIQHCDGVLSIIAAVEGSRHPAVVGEFTTLVAGDRVRFVPFVAKSSSMEVGLLYPGGRTAGKFEKLIASTNEP